MELHTPVLLVAFNRPDYTQIIFDAIKKVTPKKLYFSVDGPRPGNEQDEINCSRTREIAKQIDWDCELHTNFSEKNLGCGYGVSSGISWVFKQEESCIILEDDCLPSNSFFPFCQELLEKYKDENSILMISGDNYTEEYNLTESYTFSLIAHHIWGWASWRRAWQKFDISKDNYYKFVKDKPIKELFINKDQGLFFKEFYSRFYKRKIITHTWDFQWSFSIVSNNGLAIVPRKNLVANIGLDGAHSKGIHDFHNLHIDRNFNIEKHPEKIIQNAEYDNIHFQNHYRKLFMQRSLIGKVLNRFRKLLMND